MKKSKSDYLIQSVSRALDILEAFTIGQEEMGVTELSRKLKLHKNNVFRLLATLETRGYVEQDRQSGSYRLGIKTFEVATVFLHHRGLVRQARRALEQLAQESGETAYVAVLDGPFAVCLDVVETPRPVRVVSHLGERFPAHAAALGKAQLAFRPPADLDELWKHHEPEASTPRTIVDRARLAEELSRVAERELALEDEECEAEVRAAAAPVRDHARRVVGAIGIRGPAFRLPPDRLEGEIAALVKAAAQQVGKRLGHSVTPA